MSSRQPKLPPRGAPRRWVLRICSSSWGTARSRSGKTWILWWWYFNKMISHLLQVQRLVKYLTAHEVSTMSRFCNWSFIQLNEIWWKVSQFLTWRWPGKRRTATQLIQPLDDTPSGAKTSSRLSKILFWEPPFYLCSFLTPAHIDDASEHIP